MSSKSGASGSMRSCAGSVRLSAPAGHEVVLDALYDRKRDKKTVRVLTVIVYVFCVSLAAIMLSLYYVFFWEPKDAPYAQRKVLHTVEPRPTTTTITPMPTCFTPHTGRGDSGVSLEDRLQTSTDGPYNSTEDNTVDSTTFAAEVTTSDFVTALPNDTLSAGSTNETDIT